MDELGFRACKECGQRALIELDAGSGRVCARCYVRRMRTPTNGTQPVTAATRLAERTQQRVSRDLGGRRV